MLEGKTVRSQICSEQNIAKDTLLNKVVSIFLGDQLCISVQLTEIS